MLNIKIKKLHSITKSVIVLNILYGIPVLYSMTQIRFLISVTGIVFLLSSIFCRNKMLFLSTAILVSLLGSRSYTLLTALIVLAFCIFKIVSKRHFVVPNVTFFGILFLSYSAINFLINVIMGNANFIVFCVWILTFCVPIYSVIAGYTFSLGIHEKEKNKKMQLLTFAVCIEVFICWYQLLQRGSFKPGDYLRGTFYDAHQLGFFLGIILTAMCITPFLQFFCKIKPFWRIRKLSFVSSICLLFPLIILADGKTMYAAIFCCIPLINIVLLLFGKKKYNFGRLVLTLIILLSLILITPTLIKIYYNQIFGMNLNIGSTIEYYKMNKNLNGKFEMYNRVFKKMYLNEGKVEWVLGLGGGAFGSRASNGFATDVLYKPGQNLPNFIPPISSRFTKKYLADLWSESIFKYLGDFSFILASPFNGICSLKAESGILGGILYLLYCFSLTIALSQRLIRSETITTAITNLALLIFWTCLPFAMIVDNTQEDLNIVLPLGLITGAFLNCKKNCRYNYFKK